MEKMIRSSPFLSISIGTARQFAPVLACCGVLGFFAGCASEPNSHLVSAPPPPAPTTAVMTTTVATPVVMTTPAVVVANPGYATTAPAPVGTIYVTQAPPAVQQDVVVAQPTSQHVWLAGYWTWRNARYEWMAGHWDLPPGSASAWVSPRWERQGNAYRFYEGYWN
jgi:hypothetical protein